MASTDGGTVEGGAVFRVKADEPLVRLIFMKNIGKMLIANLIENRPHNLCAACFPYSSYLNSNVLQSVSLTVSASDT